MSKELKFESSYEWCVIPEDLPKSNLFYVTAKTASPTIHPEDPEAPIRLFSDKERLEAARSLGRRPINMNHNQKVNIENAFTVDAQFNPTTQAVEGLIYVPDRVRYMINSGMIKKVSVEYVWRDIKKTEIGYEFVGLIFDKISLLEESWLIQNNASAGDKLGEIRKVESTSNRGFFDGELRKVEVVEEKAPEQKLKQDMITEGMKAPEQGFYCVKKECTNRECGNLEKKGEVSATERKDIFITQQQPEGTNVMPIAVDGPVLNQAPVDNSQPVTNVASAGMVTDNNGVVMFGKPEEDNPHKNLDAQPAPESIEPKKEGSTLNDSIPISTSTEINVIGMDESKQKVESTSEPNKEEKKAEVLKEPEKPKEIEKPKEPEIDYKSKFEAVVKHEAELEGAVKRLQDNDKVSNAAKDVAIKEAYNKGKQHVINNIKEVIPDSSQFGFNIQNSTKSLITGIKKRLYEMSKE
jgi:hypothetical protein